MDNLIRKAIVRPWSDFFDFARFGWPDINDINHTYARFEANFEYYFGNYVVICGIIAVYAFITLPGLLISAIAIIGAGIYLYFVRKDPIWINGSQITPKQQLIGYAAGSAFLVYWMTGLIILHYALVALLVVLGHSLTRKRSVKAKLNAAGAAVSGTSLSASLSKVAEKIVDPNSDFPVRESVRYSPGYQTLQQKYGK